MSCLGNQVRRGRAGAGLLLAALCALGAPRAQAQVQDYPRPRPDLDRLLQELFAEPQSDQQPYEDLYETLLQYLQTPLNLNTATREELTSLLLLSPAQVTALLEHRERNGALLSLYELQSIDELDLRTIYRLAPFVTVGEPSGNAVRGPLWQRIRQEENNALFIRYERVLQQRKGYTAPTLNSNGTPASRYLGSPDKLLVRFRTSHARDFSIGLAAEKDAGEQLIWSPGTRRYGFDYYSAHLGLFERGRLKAVIVGDYQLQFGQGLLLSSGLQVGKGAETITTLRRSNLGIRPYTSVLESAFFRGAAATVAPTPGWRLTGFASLKRVDATLRTAVADSLEEEATDFASGLLLTGFHRTASELRNRRSLREGMVGGNVSFAPIGRQLSLGLTAVGTAFGQPLQRRPEPYNLFEFSGKQNLAVSAHYSYGWRNLSLFGETARSSSGGLGTVNGLLASLGQDVDAAVLYRHYARNFHTLYGNAFGENTRTINESGLYLGLKVRPVARWELAAYYDQFRFPWLRYQVSAPSRGYDWLVRVAFAPTKTSQLYAQVRTRQKAYDADGPRPVPEPVPTVRRSLLLFYDTRPSSILSLRTRLQGTHYSQLLGPRRTGYLLAQDVTVQPVRALRLSARYALFDTDDYDTRQYAYEQDVLYAFSVPALAGRGTRVYALAEYKLGRRITMWVRYATTTYRGQKTVGSGLEEIQGPQRSEVKAQLRVAL
ncbi:helix-hairpin-helix domain-containing protein [Hymenobacter latericus]|uniref:helix-hairpin-helix domain-containing protein n=1 Tax=Hymenobacter sp. YIM 151858-1 TaxID=2987688 RepID=UPI0022278177|nr:helix-hairpin-helix domain-containing protein [Hymenobacter sp. YIM 151858-1]UYZ57489.1 helix-hairpin-helix domain-containing protein [Hymenobacter sp. YIM 151858-1]